LEYLQEFIKTYKIVGQVFFNSADKFYKIFDFKENIDKVVIDLTRAHFWDVTAVYALDKSVLKLRKEGKEVEIIGQNEASSTIIDRFGIHDKPEEIDRIMGGH
jgi:SulP family sulfate permease